MFRKFLRNPVPTEVNSMGRSNEERKRSNPKNRTIWYDFRKYFACRLMASVFTWHNVGGLQIVLATQGKNWLKRIACNFNLVKKVHLFCNQSIYIFSYDIPCVEEFDIFMKGNSTNHKLGFYFRRRSTSTKVRRRFLSVSMASSTNPQIRER